jgi:hypothetical protein
MPFCWPVSAVVKPKPTAVRYIFIYCPWGFTAASGPLSAPPLFARFVMENVWRSSAESRGADYVDFYLNPANGEGPGRSRISNIAWFVVRCLPLSVQWTAL